MHRDILRAAVDRGEKSSPRKRVEAWIDDVIAAQGVASNREIQMADGRWLDVRTRPTDDGGRLSVFSDITVAKRAAAELLAVNAKLDDLAHRDGLTDLSTRRAFDESLEREFGRSRRSRSPLSLLLIDVDWFKRFNDAYGHPAGDECLRAVARCIQATARRPTDLAARYGGEEFAVILPETDARGAFVIAETLKAAVRDLQLEHDGSEKKMVTVSIGVATFEGSGDLEISSWCGAPTRRSTAPRRPAATASTAGGRMSARGSEAAISRGGCPHRLCGQPPSGALMEPAPTSFSRREAAGADRISPVREASTSSAVSASSASRGPAVGLSGQKIVVMPAASPAVAPGHAVFHDEGLGRVDFGQPGGAQIGFRMRACRCARRCG